MESESDSVFFCKLFEDINFFAEIDLSKKDNNRHVKRQERFNKIIERRKVKRVEEHKRRRMRINNGNPPELTTIPDLNVGNF